MPLNLVYTMVQNSQKWPKTQIKGGPALNVRRYETAVVWKTNQRYEILNMCTCVRTCGSVRVCVYYKKRGSASYIVREVRSVRERERYREKDGSDVTISALKLAMSFALFLAKNLHLVLAKSFALFLAKNLHLVLAKSFALFLA